MWMASYANKATVHGSGIGFLNCGLLGGEAKQVHVQAQIQVPRKQLDFFSSFHLPIASTSLATKKLPVLAITAKFCVHWNHVWPHED